MAGQENNKTLREWSKNDWLYSQVTLEQINTGALMRIADAVEKTVERINYLIDENIRLKNRVIKLEHQNRGLRGEITRLNRRSKRDAE